MQESGQKEQREKRHKRGAETSRAFGLSLAVSPERTAVSAVYGDFRPGILPL